jgi:hypothetical protein
MKIASFCSDQVSFEIMVPVDSDVMTGDAVTAVTATDDSGDSKL